MTATAKLILDWLSSQPDRYPFNTAFVDTTDGENDVVLDGHFDIQALADTIDKHKGY